MNKWQKVADSWYLLLLQFKEETQAATAITLLLPGLFKKHSDTYDYKK